MSTLGRRKKLMWVVDIYLQCPSITYRKIFLTLQDRPDHFTQFNVNFWTLLTWVSRKEKMIHSRIHKKSETNNGRIGMGPRHLSGVSRGKIGKYFVRLKICCCRNDSSRQATRPRLCECVYWPYCHMWTQGSELRWQQWAGGSAMLCSRIKVSKKIFHNIWTPIGTFILKKTLLWIESNF